MQVIIIPALRLLYEVLRLYNWVVIIWVVMTWLVQFNVINPRNQVVRTIGSILDQLVEPVLRHIRRRLPMFGALDLSPLVLIFGIWFLQMVIEQLIVRVA